MSTRILVTGTGRCGTLYMARLLTRLGVPCTHEKVYTQRGPVYWQASAESSWMAVPWLGEPIHESDAERVVHLVRNPLDVIWSMARMGLFADGPKGAQHGLYRIFLEKHCPEAFDFYHPVTRAGCFVHAWNARIERFALARVRVERISEDCGELRRGLGERAPDGFAVALGRALEHTPAYTNSRPGDTSIARPRWSDFAEPVAAKLATQARAYGYKED